MEPIAEADKLTGKLSPRAQAIKKVLLAADKKCAKCAGSATMMCSGTRPYLNDDSDLIKIDHKPCPRLEDLRQSQKTVMGLVRAYVPEAEARKAEIEGPLRRYGKKIGKARGWFSMKDRMGVWRDVLARVDGGETCLVVCPYLLCPNTDKTSEEWARMIDEADVVYVLSPEIRVDSPLYYAVLDSVAARDGDTLVLFTDKDEVESASRGLSKRSEFIKMVVEWKLVK